MLTSLALWAKGAVKFTSNGDRSGAVLNKYTGRNLKNCSYEPIGEFIIEVTHKKQYPMRRNDTG